MTYVRRNKAKQPDLVDALEEIDYIIPCAVFVFADFVRLPEVIATGPPTYHNRRMLYSKTGTITMVFGCALATHNRSDNSEIAARNFAKRPRL